MTHYTTTTMTTPLEVPPNTAEPPHAACYGFIGHFLKVSAMVASLIFPGRVYKFGEVENFRTAHYFEIKSSALFAKAVLLFRPQCEQ